MLVVDRVELILLDELQQAWNSIVMTPRSASRRCMPRTKSLIIGQCVRENIVSEKQVRITGVTCNLSGCLCRRRSTPRSGIPFWMAASATLPQAHAQTRHARLLEMLQQIAVIARDLHDLANRARDRKRRIMSSE